MVGLRNAVILFTACAVIGLPVVLAIYFISQLTHPWPIALAYYALFAMLSAFLGIFFALPRIRGNTEHIAYAGVVFYVPLLFVVGFAIRFAEFAGIHAPVLFRNPYWSIVASIVICEVGFAIGHIGALGRQRLGRYR